MLRVLDIVVGPIIAKEVIAVCTKNSASNPSSKDLSSPNTIVSIALCDTCVNASSINSDGIAFVTAGLKPLITPLLITPAKLVEFLYIFALATVLPKCLADALAPDTSFKEPNLSARAAVPPYA